MKSACDIVKAGRPEGQAFVCTHEPVESTLQESLGVLPYGLLEDGRIVRDYAWRRFTGAVRLSVGDAKARYANDKARVVPAVLAASLEHLGGKPATVDRIAALPYSDVALLMLDRQTERAGGHVPVRGGWACIHCRAPVGRFGRDCVPVGRVDRTPEQTPRAVCWLDSPFEYGKRGQVEALLVQAVSWTTLYGGCSASEFGNPEWSVVRAASRSVVGYLAEGELHEAVIPERVIEAEVAESDFGPLSDAVYACSAGAQMGAMVECAECKRETPVPFDWISGH